MKRYAELSCFSLGIFAWAFFLASHISGMSGTILVFTVIGSLIIIPIPLVLMEVAVETVRAAWQSVRVMNHIRAIRLARGEQGHTRPWVYRFLRNFRIEFFASYTTLRSVDGRVFYLVPWGEKAYLDRLHKEEEAYLSRLSS